MREQSARGTQSNVLVTGVKYWIQISIIATGLTKRFFDFASSTFSMIAHGLQDDLLLRAVLSHGTNWTTIAASHTPKRTTLALKNRYSALRLRHRNSSNRKDCADVRDALHRPQTGSSLVKAIGKVNGGSRDQCDTRLEQPSQEVEDDDEEEDGDGEEDEDGEDDDYEDDDYASRTATTNKVSMMPSSHQFDTGSLTSVHGKPHTAASNQWPGFSSSGNVYLPNSMHQELGQSSAGRFINDAPNYASYMNTPTSNPSLMYMDDPIFGSVQNTEEMDMGMQFGAYGTLTLLCNRALLTTM